jgi:hypothetical protein
MKLYWTSSTVIDWYVITSNVSDSTVMIFLSLAWYYCWNCHTTCCQNIDMSQRISKLPRFG